MYVIVEEPVNFLSMPSEYTTSCIDTVSPDLIVIAC